MINKTLHKQIIDRGPRTPIKTEDELMCTERVSSSCSTRGTRLQIIDIEGKR
jgi:hypothetical protein